MMRKNQKEKQDLKPLTNQVGKPVPQRRGLLSLANHNPADLERMRSTILALQQYVRSDPTRVAKQDVVVWINKAVRRYENAFKASIGMPSMNDSVTTQRDAPLDIPTVPLDGFQLVQRLCYIPKLASLGTAGGGFFATLTSGDLAPFLTAQTGQKFFRVNKVTSWTVPRADGNANQGTFAGVSVPATEGAGGTEVMPLWSENWSPIGKGFAGIVTQYPLGDFPQLTSDGTAVNILSHYTSLGGTGGIINVPVVFHVLVECLI